MQYKVDIDTAAAEAMLNRFQATGLSSLMETLGALVEGQTKRRIAVEKTSPDGEKWKPLAPLTVALRRKGSSSQLTDTGRLLGSISHTSSRNSAIVGTNVFYAPFHQYGVESIKPKKAGGRLAIPMGGGRFAFAKEVSIPARPFMGVSAKNMVEIKAAVDAWVEALL